MSYLLAKIFLCLLFAGLLGVFIGWLLRGAQARTRLMQRETEWLGRLSVAERESEEVKGRLKQSDKAVSQLKVVNEQALTDNKTLASQSEAASELAERLRQSLAQEQQKSKHIVNERDERQRNLQEADQKLAQQHAAHEVLLASEKRLQSTNEDLNTYLEAANAQKNQFKEEAYRLGKELNENAVLLAKKDETIEQLASSGNENSAELDALKKQLSTRQRENEIMTGRIGELESALHESQTRLGSQGSEYELKEAELRQEVAKLTEARQNLEKELAEVNSRHEVQLNLATKEREAVSGDQEALKEKADVFEREATQLKQMLLDKEDDLKQRQSRFNERVAELESEKQTLEQQIGGMRKHEEFIEEELSDLERQLEEVRRQYDDRESVLEQTRQRLNMLEIEETEVADRLKVVESGRDQELQQMRGDYESAQSEIERLKLSNEQLTGLVEQNKQRLLNTEEAEQVQQKEADRLKADLATAQEQLDRLRTQNERFDEAAGELSARDARVTQLERENEKLLAALQETSDEVVQLKADLEGTGFFEQQGEKPTGLETPRGEKPDDLKRISGVGPKIESILHDLGIYHFSQIAEFTKENVDWVNAHLRFKGRIEREEWIKQARTLVQGGVTDFSRRYDSGETDSKG